METEEYIYEGVVETSYKNLWGQMPTILVSAGIWDENMTNQILNPRWVRNVASTEKVMYIIWGIDPN